MAQHDMVIDNSTGLNVRLDINNALAALQSCSSGATAPTTNVVAGQLFYNTSTQTLSVRNAANSAWVDIATGVAAVYLALTGGILTGDLTISKTSPGLLLNKPAAGTPAYMKGMTNNVDRWSMRLGNDTAEGGANTGSDFELRRFNDGGTYQDSPIQVNRATGAVTGNFVMPAAWAHRSGAGNNALGTNVFTKVNLGTLGSAVGGFTLSGNSLVVPRAGLYSVNVSCSIQLPASICVAQVGFDVDGNLVPAAQTRIQNSVANNYLWVLNVSRVIDLNAGDTLAPIALCSVAGAVVTDTPSGTFLSAHMVAAQ